MFSASYVFVSARYFSVYCFVTAWVVVSAINLALHTLFSQYLLLVNVIYYCYVAGVK